MGHRHGRRAEGVGSTAEGARPRAEVEISNPKSEIRNPKSEMGRRFGSRAEGINDGRRAEDRGRKTSRAQVRHPKSELARRKPGVGSRDGGFEVPWRVWHEQVASRSAEKRRRVPAC